MKANDLYIGLMSGTSLDAVDAALVRFEKEIPQLIATHQETLPTPLRQNILDLCYPNENAIQRLGETDTQLGRLFAQSVLALLKKTPYSKENIQAIGSHGQTIRHVPDTDTPFTLQIGDPNIIAAQTGITTVADFRRRDMALGGQAAPLVPAFHHYLFQNRKKNLGVLNIGGIANVTFLPANPNETIIGFDTGPGNTLLDAWCMKHIGKHYDKNGEWADSGNCHSALLSQLLADPYFQKVPPKSTGREYFDLNWLQEKCAACQSTFSANDIQSTLLELTAHSIVNALAHFRITHLWVCGGGTQNTALMRRLNTLGQYAVQSTEVIDIHPDWMEAVAFAWLARQTLLGKPGNIPSVTGASASSILGGIYHK